MTFEAFEQQAMGVCISEGWRPGQALFNVLSDVRPEIAERIRGGMFDPFHIESVEDERFRYCREFIRTVWTISWEQ